MNKLIAATGLLALLSACSQPARQSEEARVTNNAAAPPPVVESPVQPMNGAAPAPAPAATPTPEAQRPTLDPKSSAAAEALVRGFVDLLNAGKLNEAYMLLGPAAPPRKQFDQHFAGISDLAVTMGAAGDQEGAAGSIYLSVPLTVTGSLDGKQISRSATATVRRVNDVPGSTEAQRRWHIERLEWKASS